MKILKLGLALWMVGGMALAQEMQVERMEAGRSDWIKEAVYQREASLETGDLLIRMDEQAITYLDVPAAVWREFLAAESPGAYYAKNIKMQYERQIGTPRAARYDSPAPVEQQVAVRGAFNEECEPLVLSTIHGAHTSILMAAYAFTRTRVVMALADAHRRGVSVKIKVDTKQAEYPLAAKALRYLAAKGIEVTHIYTEGEYAAMHNKFLVVDDRYVVTGSYNFTTTAHISNWENILWLDAPGLAAQYTAAWQAICSDPEPVVQTPARKEKKKAKP